jgi:hypothetical protein
MVLRRTDRRLSITGGLSLKWGNFQTCIPALGLSRISRHIYLSMQDEREYLHVRALNGTAAENSSYLDILDLPLASAEKACKECSRRKVKCDKAIPVCGICSRYRRHCLYEKYTKTPLTRKYDLLAPKAVHELILTNRFNRHLTEIEERLERAERLLRQARANSLLPRHIEDALPETWRPSLSLSFSQDTSAFPLASPLSPSSQEKGLGFNAFNSDQQLPIGDDSSRSTTAFVTLAPLYRRRRWTL